MRGKIGIRREDIDAYETRAPFSPSQVRQIIEEFEIAVEIETSAKRVFEDEAYRQSGARIVDDLTDCNFVFGIKEIPIARLQPEFAYCFFSHTIKGQPYNMPRLNRLLEIGGTLIDYERIVNENGKRVVSFSRFAGYAGMVNTLWAFGQRMKALGIASPFEKLEQAMNFKSLALAREAVSTIGRDLQTSKLTAGIAPLVCGFAGTGAVSQGAQEIFDLLKPESITPAELLSTSLSEITGPQIFKVVFTPTDTIRRNDHRDFKPADLFTDASQFISTFDRYLDRLSVLVNAVYWQPGFPRLITINDLKKLYQKSTRPKLQVIGDISCDIEGAIECTLEYSNSGNPVYVYDPLQHQIRYGFEGNGPAILAVDKLPNEFAVEASEAFGLSLLPYVRDLARSDRTVSFDDLAINEQLKNAMIAYRGQLTPKYEYLTEFLHL